MRAWDSPAKAVMILVSVLEPFKSAIVLSPSYRALLPSLVISYLHRAGLSTYPFFFKAVI